MAYNYNYTSLRGRAQEIIWLYGTNGRWKISPLRDQFVRQRRGRLRRGITPILERGVAPAPLPHGYGSTIAIWFIEGVELRNQRYIESLLC